MEYKHGPWYIREHGKIRGPFMASIITNHIIVGRLSLDSEVSTDKQQWIVLRDQFSLHPTTAEYERAQRSLDERTGIDRRQHAAPSGAMIKQRKAQRRSKETGSLQHRQFRRLLLEKYHQHRQQRLFWPLMSVFLLLLFSLVMAMLFPTRLPLPLANCDAPPAAEVNWDNCLKAGLDLSDEDLTQASMRNSQLSASVIKNSVMLAADLSYADLSHVDFSDTDLSQAKLIGAKLTGANLTHADLSHADFSYADLTLANLSNANLQFTRFDHAIWINGETCAAASLGECRPLE